VGEQDRGRVQPVLGEQGVQPVNHPDARINNQALLTRRGREHVTVRPERVRCEAGDEHV
jgi:hypothetical protein